LTTEGARVQAHDPAVDKLPDGFADSFVLMENATAALNDASALVLATPWPDYQSYDAETLISKMKTPLVIDANRFLEESLGVDARIRYAGIGKGWNDK
jgi:UDP-glucose 6-dehydrogenase